MTSARRFCHKIEGQDGYAALLHCEHPMPVVRAILIVLFVLFSLALGRAATVVAVWLGRSADVVPLLFCRATLCLLGVEVEISGSRCSKTRLVVGNHVSWIDVLAIGSVEPLSFVAKHDVASWPLAGALARRQQTIFVDRRRWRKIPAVNAEMADRLLAGRSVLLFPEGTTFEVGSPGPFKTSHLASLRDALSRSNERSTAPAVAVQTIAISYNDPMAAWIGDDTLLPHIWAVLRRRGLCCRLIYGEPVTVESGFDRKRLGRALRERITDALQDGQRSSAAEFNVLTHVHKLVVSGR